MPKKTTKTTKKSKTSKKNYSAANFKTWKFGTLNIRSGTEKDDGAKIYSIAKEIAKSKLAFCCLQEVRWRDVGSKIIRLDTGEEFGLVWFGLQAPPQAESA